MNISAFIEGFVKKAVDLGYEDDAIAELFKSAMADPQAGQMFKNIDQPGVASGNGMQQQPQPLLPPQPQDSPSHALLVQQMLRDPRQAVQLQQLLGIR